MNMRFSFFKVALWGIWLVSAVLCLILLYQQYQMHHAQLPLPKSIYTVDIIRPDTTLHFQAQPKWQSEGKAADKLGKWLNELRQSCLLSYPENAISLPEEHQPITLRFNQHDDWVFTAYNSFNHSHYLHHQGRVYLCHEQFKPRLSLPLDYWLEPLF